MNTIRRDGGRWSFEKKKRRIGYAFIASWLIGFFLLYAKPLVESLVYTFHTLKVTSSGFEMNPAGLDNYRYAFFSDPDFLRILLTSLKDILYQTPTILVFSLLIALLLNPKFRGRGLMRAVFFLPVTIASGVVINIINGDVMSTVMMSSEKSGQLFEVDAFYEMLIGMGLGESLVSTIVGVANNIFELSWQSGIQITLILAGLQSISPTLYEAAAMDGGTKWEVFWFITFPMLTPILMVALIYTVVEMFTNYSNPVMQKILEYGNKLNFAYSSTIAWLYFLVIAVLLALVFLLFGRRVVYAD